MWSRFKTFDPLLYIIPLIFTGFSIVMIYTLTNDTAGWSTAIKQLVSAGVGILAMLAATFIDYRSLKAWSFWIFLLGLSGLVAVEIIGASSFGAARWIDLGFTNFQPGEFFKWILIIVLAAQLSRTSHLVRWGEFIVMGIGVLIPILLVLMQPDLGTTLVLVVTAVALLLHGRTSKLQRVLVLLLVSFAALSIVLSFMNVKPFTGILKDYQKDRLASFIEPQRDKTTGYNVRQSKIAVGSGGLLGKTLGKGSQSQLNFLPVAHADFIFAGIAEAWGFAGSLGVIILYAVLVIRILHAAQISKDDFGMLICVGVAAKLIFEVGVNIGMNIGVMPVTGIPLPFLSYGGTALMTNMILLGIVQSVVIRYKRLTFEQ